MIPYTPKELTENVNVSKESPVKELFKLLTGSLLCLVLGVIALGCLVDLCVPLIPADWEASFGKLFDNKLVVRSSDKAESTRMQGMLDRLQAVDAKPHPHYHVHLVHDSTVNALALPGGNILLYTGLKDKLKSDNEIAFVLAHELGHFAHRDHLRGIGRSLVTSMTLITIFGDTTLGKISTNSSGLMQMQFSQQQETAADEYALDLLNRSEHHVAGALAFFKTLESEGAFDIKALNFASSHPATTDRLENMKRLIREKHYAL